MTSKERESRSEIDMKREKWRRRQKDKWVKIEYDGQKSTNQKKTARGTKKNSKKKDRQEEM